MKTIAMVVAMMAMAACGGAPEQTGRTSADLTAADALTACQVLNGNTCVVVPVSCNGDMMVDTFGGDSQTCWNGLPCKPQHVDELDGWVWAGPHAGQTVKYVTTTVNGIVAPAAYACSTDPAHPGPPVAVTGTW